MSFTKILSEIQSNIKKILIDMNIDVNFSVEPAKLGFGDVSSNISFLLAKELKKNPKDIAVSLSEKYRPFLSDFVSTVQPHNSGYLNFSVNWDNVTRMIITESVHENYGSINIGNGMRVVVEHTSVNPNKALHIGHVRNIVIGDTIARLLQKTNHNVNVLNYVDDSGLQVADIVLGFKHLGFDEEPPIGKKFDHYCGDDIYVKTTEQYESNKSLEDIRKNILKEIEEGTSDVAKFARKITRRVLADQLETCWNLSVYYDCLNFESQIVHSGMWNDIFEKLKTMNLIEFESQGKNQGCWIIRGHTTEEDKVIVRSNGTATYIAKDIPYAAWKLGLINDPFNYAPYEKKQQRKDLWQTTLEKTNFPKLNLSGNRVITVIDSRQERLQKIITTLMSKFKSDPDAYIHLGYESVTLSPDTAQSLGIDTKGKQAQMSGRRGHYVNADSVYDLLKTKSIEETRKRNPEMNDAEINEIAHKIAVGTLRYEMIKQDLDKIISFDLTKSLSLEGDTSSYIQYTYARASRIIAKSGRVIQYDVDYSFLNDPHEKALILLIGLFDINIGGATRNLSPKVMAKYCHDLAVAFNSFYEHNKVLDTGNVNLENARLCLVSSFLITMVQSLELIGISAPIRM